MMPAGQPGMIPLPPPPIMQPPSGHPGMVLPPDPMPLNENPPQG